MGGFEVLCCRIVVCWLVPTPTSSRGPGGPSLAAGRHAPPLVGRAAAWVSVVARGRHRLGAGVGTEAPPPGGLYRHLWPRRRSLGFRGVGETPPVAGESESEGRRGRWPPRQAARGGVARRRRLSGGVGRAGDVCARSEGGARAVLAKDRRSACGGTAGLGRHGHTACGGFRFLFSHSARLAGCGDFGFSFAPRHGIWQINFSKKKIFEFCANLEIEDWIIPTQQLNFSSIFMIKLFEFILE